MHRSKPARIFGFVILGIFGVLALGLVIMSLWNWLVPSIFNGPTISYGQALGLFLLSKLLLSGGHGGGGPRKRHHREHWKTHLHAKVESTKPRQEEEVVSVDVEKERPE